MVESHYRTSSIKYNHIYLQAYNRTRWILGIIKYLCWPFAWLDWALIQGKSRFLSFSFDMEGPKKSFDFKITPLHRRRPIPNKLILKSFLGMWLQLELKKAIFIKTSGKSCADFEIRPGGGKKVYLYMSPMRLIPQWNPKFSWSRSIAFNKNTQSKHRRGISLKTIDS